MSVALYYKPSYERLESKIKAIAPDLTVALYDENGGLSLNGEPISLAALKPEYFWIHGELLASNRLADYFRLMNECDSIRWLHTMNTGLDGLPYLDVMRKGVQLSNNHGQAIAIAEFVFGQVLAHFQNIALFKQRQAEGLWKPKRFREICSSRWTIVGFGHIGQAVAKRAKAFGAQVTAVRRSADGAGLADKVVGLAQLNEVLPDTDVLILACGSNDATRGCLGLDQFQKMKTDAVLVNIARGDLVVEDDLRTALDQDLLGYAVLDVFNTEPPAADNWVWQHPKVGLTPHTSHAGTGTPGRSAATFLENLKRKVNGEPLLNLVSEQENF